MIYHKPKVYILYAIFGSEKRIVGVYSSPQVALLKLKEFQMSHMNEFHIREHVLDETRDIGE